MHDAVASSLNRNSVAIMNTKGGVGKSTLVLAIAETLATYHDKSVLVIDSDSQATVSSMFMSIPSLHNLQQGGQTLVDYLVATVLQNSTADFTRFIVQEVSDVDDVNSVFAIPSDMQLTLFEREVSKGSLHGRLRSVIRGLLNDARNAFDIVLVDCPPGLSVLTESWLREADFHISPTKADYVSVCGLEVFRRFKALNPEMGFADNLGVLINMRDPSSASEDDYEAWLREDTENKCFKQVVPRAMSLQEAARFQTIDRSYMAKYPGIVGQSLRALSEEVLQRVAEGQQRLAQRQSSETEA